MRVKVLSGVERRRQWSDAEKARIVKETLVPGARVAEVARRGVGSGKTPNQKVEFSITIPLDRSDPRIGNGLVPVSPGITAETNASSQRFIGYVLSFLTQKTSHVLHLQ